jgi:hypothetical protein
MFRPALITVLVLLTLPAAAQPEMPAMQALERRIEAVTRILEPITAGEMAEKCERTDNLLFNGESAYDPTEMDLIDAGLCASYFASILDMLEAIKVMGVKVPGICEPRKGLTGPLVKEAFMNFLGDHPETEGLPTVTVALAAWTEYHPCR